MTQDKQLKRRARELAAETGQSYQAALYQLDPDRQRKPTVPTLAELRAAVELLRRAWTPPPVAVADPQDEDDWDDEDEWTNGCNCGGRGGDDDYDDQPRCNCGSGCGCKSCNHYQHVETLRCRVPAPRENQPYAWCGKRTLYRVVPYCVHRDGITCAASKGDLAADERGNVRLGDSIQRHQPTYACSTEHARALIAADQEYRGRHPDDSVLSAPNTYYEVDRFRYEPDEIDVPSPLHRIRREAWSVEHWAGQAIAHTFAGITERRALQFDVEIVLRAVSAAAFHAVEYLEHRDQQAEESDE